ncbi:MAG: hypothetical protein GXC73_08210 [Chitinophagaceae bacterium]|nr:hypothetical protein [Chitinophagaceae bacterium]
MTMRFVKTITAVLLLFFMLVPFVAPVLLQLRQKHIQHEMLERLEKEQLVTLRVKARDVQWVKPGKEIAIGHEMFDIKNMKTDGDDLVLTGLYDAEEKALKKLIRQQSQQESKQSKQTLQLLSALGLPAEAANIFSYTPLAANINNLFRDSFYHSPFLGFLTPPPKQHTLFV